MLVNAVKHAAVHYKLMQGAETAQRNKCILAQGALRVVSTAVRVLWPDGASGLPTDLQEMIQRGLAASAACSACNHKDVAMAALSCLAAIVGEPLDHT